MPPPRQHPGGARGRQHRQSQGGHEPALNRSAHLAQPRDQHRDTVESAGRPGHVPQRRNEDRERRNPQPGLGRSHGRQGKQQQAGVEVILRDIGRPAVVSVERPQPIGCQQSEQGFGVQHALCAARVIGVRTDGMPRQFHPRQDLDACQCDRAQRDSSHNRHRAPPAPQVCPQIAQGVEAHAEEAIHRRLKVPGQKHAPARETAQRRIAHSRAVGRAPVGQKQPRKPCRRGENPDVRTVLREKPGQTVGQRAQRRRAAIRHQPPQEKIRSQARQQGVERQLQLNRPRGDAGQEERPVRRIPGTHLRIGQQRIAGKQIGRPEGKARPEPVRHVLLQRDNAGPPHPTGWLPRSK